VTLLRIVLVGTPDDRDRLRRELGAVVEVVGGSTTLAAARTAFPDADAYLVASASRRDDAGGDALEPGETLTPRELEVLRQLALGLPNKAIAGRLGISDQTVKFHVASIIGKLGASNRTDAVRRALRRGWVDV
jgi:DNA-binding NarL/FixJ family response regulator